jgi:hypothetical protein
MTLTAEQQQIKDDASATTAAPILAELVEACP